MTKLQKFLGQVFPPYKYKVQRQELKLLIDSLINGLPGAFDELKEQRSKTNLLFLDDWSLFPGFKFLTIVYPGTTMSEYKKRGENYKLSGQRIFSRKKKDYVNVEFLIHDNYLAGIKIDNSNYDIEEFDLSRIEIQYTRKTPVEFPPSDVDLFYQGLGDNLKNKLAPDTIFDIDFGNCTYYAFYDLEDGNYLATDKKLNVFSLVHDARPMAKKMKWSLASILDEIEMKSFDKDKHLDERYRNSV